MLCSFVTGAQASSLAVIRSLQPRRLRSSRNLAAQIEIEAATATALRREERFQQSRHRGEIARLNQQFTGTRELGDNAFTADHAAKETRGGLAQSVLRRALPCDQMTSIDDVTLAGLQALAMNGAE